MVKEVGLRSTFFLLDSHLGGRYRVTWMKNAFAITGMGRSGTLFLATMMNRSEIWTVEHEPWPLYNLDEVMDVVHDRFDRDNYGEVNSYLRDIFCDLGVKKKGVIRRNPADVFISICNWEDDFVEKLPEKIDFIKRSFEAVDRVLEADDIYPIVFERLTTEPDYINQVIADFGINDVVLKEEDLERKIHRADTNSFQGFEALTSEQVALFWENLAWFSEKYDYEVP